MSYTGAMSEIRALIEAQASDPLWRYVLYADGETEPEGTMTTHRYSIEDRGVVSVGPVVGPGAGVRMETRSLAIVIRYIRKTDRYALECEIMDDLKGLTNLLIARSNWAGSANIVAVLATGQGITITREKHTWKAEATYQVIIRA